ncbi:MAG: DUF1080 domain-containing protein [Cytophagaceae bacterium]|nr:DUF1080 domain-containing protein [Cytophagaceae bacterium]
MKHKNILLILALFSVILANAQKGKWVKLTDGKSFKNWHIYNHPGEPVNEKWKIVDGVFVFDKTAKSEFKINDLISDKEYENFELELEWKIAEKGNSGIFYGVVEDKKYSTPYLTGPEIQVLDDEGHPDAKQGKNGNRKAGSLYDVIPTASKAKPAGEWNKVKIKKLNNQVTVWQNSQLAVTYPSAGSEWDTMIEGSKFKGWEGFGKFSKGKIGLQDHGDVVSYRRIRIKEL